MRTLKKTLCLVLCLAMMAGLCVFATADFEDQDKIENEEAVAVLTGIGVIQGDDKGNFNPEGTLTRAEATVIITKVLDAADIKATTDAFTDVTAEYWGMPYIAYCVAEGIVAGNGDGTFAPNAKLTGYAWATMLLRTLGYKIEGANWQIDVAKLVKSLELADGITFVGTEEISRQDACQMALNAMFANKVEYVGGSKVTIGGVEVVTGETLKETTETLADTFNLKADNSADQYDELGNPIELTYTAGKKNTVIYTKAVAPVLTITDGSFNKTKLEKAKYDFSGVAEADIVYNGGYDSSVTYATLGKPGAIVKVYGTQSGKTIKVTDVVVEEYYLATIKDYNVKTKAITLTVMEAGYYLSNSAYKDITLTYDKNKDADEQSDNYLALADYDKGDVFAILVKGGWENSLTIFDTAAVETVEGKVTSSKMDNQYNGYVKVDGVQYTFANEYTQADVAVKSEGTFYLFNGCILGFEATEEDEVVAKDFLYVYKYADQKESAGNLLGGGAKEDRAVAQVAFTDGTVETIELNLYKKGNKVYVQKPASDGTVSATEMKDNDVTADIGAWFGYVEESDGTYTLSAIDSTKMNATVVTSQVTVAANKVGAFGDKYTNSATVYTAIDSDLKTVTKVTGLYEKDIVAAANKTLITYAKGSKVVSNVYIVDYSITAATAPKTDYAYAAKEGDTVANGTEWTFYIKGEKVTKVISGETEPEVGKIYELTEVTTGTYEGTFTVDEGTELTVKTPAKVTVADKTFFAVESGVVYYAKDAAVYDITEGADGAVATVEADDYVIYMLDSSNNATLVYIVDEPAD